MHETTEALKAFSLPPGNDFFDELARRILSFGDPAELSSWHILVPALPIAAELRAALVRTAPGPLLLPRCDTLRHWVGSVHLAGIPEALPESERRVPLHEALRQRGWFDERALWGIVAEMAGLFDELTAASVRLPDDAATLAEQLQNAYALRGSAPLAFEARVVHELWRALGAAGAPDAATVYRLQLSELARQAECAASPRPLLVLLDAAPDEALEPAEQDFLRRYGAAQTLHVFYPQAREDSQAPVPRVLAAAWISPTTASTAPLGASLLERAHALARTCPEARMSERLALVPAAGREQEARAAVAQVGAWLRAGLRRIALIAQDRLTARRVRALLERDNVLVSDETGWLLSTSRAAASIDALLEVVAGRAYYRDVLDLCKAPFFLADMDADERQTAIADLETVVRAGSVRSGLTRMRRVLLASDVADKRPGFRLLDRLEEATGRLRGAPTTLARWLDRLLAALDTLGMCPALAADIAGRPLLDLLEERRLELARNASVFSFAAWRDWLGREFEGASFRDGDIVSPIVLTPLNAVCLRRFEAVLLLGGDAGQLTPAEHAEFFNTSVRRELGLRTREDGERELKRDLELLLSMVPRVVVTWQSERDGEANLLAPELSLLSTLHRLAWGDDLQRPPLPPLNEPDVNAATAPAPAAVAAPSAPLSLVPVKVSVSACAGLVACPYLFFARHVLGLGTLDEVSEDLDKRGYGEFVHRILERFHTAHPSLAAVTDDEALTSLRTIGDEVFALAVADNFLATGWRLRWEKRLTAYLDWQRGIEAEGWRWARAETRVARRLALPDGGEVEVYGRIDRIDVHADGTPGAALYDYKTQRSAAIKKRLDDDVQLPMYALLHGDTKRAAYVALDDERIVAVDAGGASERTDPQAGGLADAAQAQGDRFVRAFAELRAGAPLPAHGVERVCTYCEMRGLCRRDHV